MYLFLFEHNYTDNHSRERQNWKPKTRIVDRIVEERSVHKYKTWLNTLIRETEY